MKLPFTIDQFMEVFARYNLAIWPGQIVAYLFGAAALLFAFKRTRHSGRMISAVLSCLWIWNGIAYHISFFSQINKAAFAFGIFFILEGVLFFWNGVIRSILDFRIRRDLHSYLGLLMIFYATIIYPVIGHLLGHRFPHSPVYGVAPCPTTIFTFGLLLCLERRAPWSLLWIPLSWAAVGTSAALVLGVPEDLGLTVSGLLTISMALLWKRKEKWMETEQIIDCPSGIPSNR